MSSTLINLELRFLRVPAIWTAHRGVIHHERGETVEYFYAPEVDCRATPEPVEDPWRLRDRFLRMEHTEVAAINFLMEIGVWNAMPNFEPQSNLPKTRLSGDFGFRRFSGVATPLTLEELWAEQDTWKELLRGPARTREAKLRARFGPPPGIDARISDKMMFALNTELENTLPMHLEWKHKQSPHSVLQPITGREMLIATTWVDLVSGSEFQECAECGTPFTWQGKKRMYCPPPHLYDVSPCAHRVAQREYKKRKDEEKKQAARLKRKMQKSLR